MEVSVSFAHFQVGLFFLLLNIKHFWYIVDNSTSLDAYFSNNFFLWFAFSFF